MSDSLCVTLSDLSRTFGATRALDHIDAEIYPGVMHGIIGPEGAGKTTLMRLIMGLLKPDTGRVQFFQNGTEINAEAFRPHIAYMPQQQSLYPDLSIQEHLDFFKALYGISSATYKEKREALLELTRLSPFLDRPAGQLSGGMYKKLGLMCALLHTPKILLLDEPTNGVDPISRREFWDMLYQLLHEDIIIIMCTSYMDEAQKCGKVLLLSEGKKVAFGTPAELLQTYHAKTFDEIFLKEWSHESH